MHIFVASGIFHPEAGGPATYLYRLLPAIQARGHTVRVLTFGDAPVEGYPYPLRRVSRRAFPLRMADYARAAWPEIRRADRMFVNSLGLPLPTRPRKPRVLKVVGDLAWERAINRGWLAPTEDVDVFQTQSYSARVRYLQRQRAHEVQCADCVIVPSAYLRRMVIGWGAPPERVQVITNALAPEATASDLSPADARAALSLDDSGPLLLTVGRLVAWKGIDHLIHAMRSVPDVRLLVAGDGPEEARLRALVSDTGTSNRVIFLGRVPRERLALYFRAADYTALYSGYEGLSHTLLESLMNGTPVIASDKGGNPEVVRHNQNGLLVPYNDPGALAETIRAAFTGDTRARLAAQTGTGLERFRWDTMVEQTIQVLETVCVS